MPTITDTAVCLRRWDFSETSQTVSLFTRTHGIIRGLAKGAKRPTGVFSGGLDVLTRGQVVVIVKPSRELGTITEWNLEATYRVLRQRLDANRAGLYMADLTHHLLTDQDPHPTLYEAFVTGLEGLGEPDAVERTLLTWQWALLEEVGYRPEVDRDAETGASLPGSTLAFSPRAGGLVANTIGPERWRVRQATAGLLRDIGSGQSITNVNDETLRRANRLLAAYCRDLIGRELPTMRWAFSDLGI